MNFGIYDQYCLNFFEDFSFLLGKCLNYYFLMTRPWNKRAFGGFLMLRLNNLLTKFNNLESSNLKRKYKLNRAKNTFNTLTKNYSLKHPQSQEFFRVLKRTFDVPSILLQTCFKNRSRKRNRKNTSNDIFGISRAINKCWSFL